jgi:hypothetical protein
MSTNRSENTAIFYMAIGLAVLVAFVYFLDILILYIMPLVVGLVFFSGYKYLKYSGWFDNDEIEPYATDFVVTLISVFLVSGLLMDAGGFLSSSEGTELNKCTNSSSSCPAVYRGNVLFLFEPFEICNSNNFIDSKDICLRKPILSFGDWNTTKVGKFSDLHANFNHAKAIDNLSDFRLSKANNFCQLVKGLTEQRCAMMQDQRILGAF